MQPPEFPGYSAEQVRLGLTVPVVSLEQTLDELVDQFARLRLTDRRRGALASQIRRIEAAIEARAQL